MPELEDDLQEQARLQAAARVQRLAYDSASTPEEKRSALNAVFTSTVTLVNHENLIPARRRAAAEATVSRWLHGVSSVGFVLLAAAGVVTLFAPWVSAWWLILGLAPAAVCAQMLDTPHVIARCTSLGNAKAVAILGGACVVVATATMLLAPVLSTGLRAIGVIATIVLAATSQAATGSTKEAQ